MGSALSQESRKWNASDRDIPSRRSLLPNTTSDEWEVVENEYLGSETHFRLDCLNDERLASALILSFIESDMRVVNDTHARLRSRLQIRHCPCAMT